MTAFAGTAMAVSPEQRDLDVDAVTLKSYVRNDHEFIVTVTGGFGAWTDSTAGAQAKVDMTEGTLTFGYYDADASKVDALCDVIERILNRWMVANTPLRMAAAPGTQTVLVEDIDKYLPIPRD